MDRREFLKCSGGAALGVTALLPKSQVIGNARNLAEKPNILLITADDLGLQVGCYGDKYAKTPQLDSLSKKSVLFTNAYTAQASCSPARSSMLTGLYPHQNGQLGLTGGGYKIHDDIEMIPELLSKSGYRTGVIGKIHVAPEERTGFQWRGISAKQTRHVKKVALNVAHFIQNDKSRPFFLMLNYSEPHRPYHKDITSNFTRYNQVDGIPQHPQQPEDVKTFEFIGMDTQRLRVDTAGYYNSVARLDIGIGLVLKELGKAQVAENTVVIFVSDQGPGSTRAKLTCYEAGLRIPLIIKWPGVSKSALRSEKFVCTTDVMPTIAEIAGIKLKKNCSSRSLVPLLKGEKVNWRKSIFTEYNSHGNNDQFYPRRAIRKGQFKLIHNLLHDRPNLVKKITGCSAWEAAHKENMNGTIVQKAYDTFHQPPEIELYDLKKDPWEFNNIAGANAYVKVKQELFEELQEWRKKTNDPFFGIDKPDQIIQKNVQILKKG